MTIDERTRGAAQRLRDEVAATVDTDAALEQLLAVRQPRWRWLPLAAAVAGVAAVALVSAGVVMSDDHAPDDHDEVTIDVQPDPDAEGTPLQLLAPDDGRQSIGLPVTIEPATGFVDGQVVHVTASGFEPGESVGIVQCTAEAREPVYAGVGACRISPFTQVTADGDGAVAGDFTLTRELTSPFSGTVDCAAAPDRCLIGVGALANYDRSGGFGLTFAPADGTIEIPVVEVSATTALDDGEVVHVSGSGFAGDGLVVSICATSPAACWSTGDPAAADAAGDVDRHLGGSLAVAEDGTIDGDLPVWRFLPGPDPGTYVDCLVSVCTLRFEGVVAPAPVPLTFAGREDPPVAPELVVAPVDGIRPGDDLTITGSGFAGGDVLALSFCTVPPAPEVAVPPGAGVRLDSMCTSFDQVDHEVDVAEDGTFEVAGTLPSFDRFSCPPEEVEFCEPTPVGADWAFELQTYLLGTRDAGAFPPPTFGPPPLPLVVVP